jgi:hypothetical protein
MNHQVALAVVAARGTDDLHEFLVEVVDDRKVAGIGRAVAVMNLVHRLEQQLFSIA